MKILLQLGLIYKQRFGKNFLASERLKTLINKDPAPVIEVQALYHLYKIYQNKNDSLSDFSGIGYLMSFKILLLQFY